MPLVLSNSSVLDSGVSVKAITHSWLPLALLGFQNDRVA